jgi:hypothetical protein
MTPMGSAGTGLLLTTGERIGRWSLSEMDGKREEPPPTAAVPNRPLPSSAAASGDDPAADGFANRMMENESEDQQGRANRKGKRTNHSRLQGEGYQRRHPKAAVAVNRWLG